MAKLKHPFKHLDQWYRHGMGAGLLELECAQVAGTLSKIHGDYLLQIGGPTAMEHCMASAIPYRFRLSTELPFDDLVPRVQADLMELPIMPNGIDVVLLPHTLEFSEDPVKLLKEIYQALAPGGQLILLGFNPYSLWGLARGFGYRRGIPWKGRFWSRLRVRHWLRKLGYSIVVSKTLCFRWPTERHQHYRMTDFPEVMGQLCWPGCGSVYFMVAQKKVYAPLLQKLDWWGRRMPARSRIIEPTTRV